MRFRLRSVGLAGDLGLVALAATAPAQAEFKDVSVHSKLESLAAAAGRVLEVSTQAIAGTEARLAPHLQSFAKMLNEQKARLAIIGEDAVDCIS